MATHVKVALSFPPGRTKPGSVHALVVSYYKSDEWNGLTADTQKTRRRIIERFRTEHGDKRVAMLHREHIEKMLGDFGTGKLSAKRH